MARRKPKKRNTQGRKTMARAWRKWIIPVVVVLGVLALVVPTVLPGIVGSPQPADSALPTEDMGESQQPEAFGPGSAAPGFSLEDTEGETISLESLQGKPVVVTFFAPWCPHCQDDAPRLNLIHAEYGDRVHIVSISATPWSKDYPTDQTSRISLDDLKWFQEEYGVTYPLLFDPSIEVGSAYMIRSFPTTFVLDAEHRVVEVFEGDRPVADYQRALDGVLSGE